MRTPKYAFSTSRRPVTHPQHEPAAAHGERRCPRRQDGIHQPAPATASLHCFALPELNQTVAVVVLGARSNAGRFWETRHLLNWINSRAKLLVGGDGRSRPPAYSTRRADRHLSAEGSEVRPQPRRSGSTRTRAAAPPRRAAAWRSCRRRA